VRVQCEQRIEGEPVKLHWDSLIGCLPEGINEGMSESAADTTSPRRSAALSPRRSAATDEQIDQAWGGGAPELNATITLVSYDQDWPALFVREAGRIRRLLGDRVLLLEHVGSTSVPGLAAKPVVDILLVLADPAAEPSWLPPLEDAGYRLVIREPAWYQHRALKGPDTNINLHVHPPDSPEIRRHLLFRDWLRTHDDDRDLYERTKRELASRTWKYMQNYADAKTEVIESILAKAARRTIT
jgi:GrpB-like predicted nucleotidyltransferase (UPF0157 family)